jgi:hypothetical protein
MARDDAAKNTRSTTVSRRKPDRAGSGKQENAPRITHGDPTHLPPAGQASAGPARCMLAAGKGRIAAGA